MRRLIAVLALSLTACPGPKYPACEKDEDCKKNAAGAPIDEFCVNQQCQECKEDAQCSAGGKCQGGRCVAAGCGSDADCQSGQICEARSCVQAQCSADADCSSGEKCDTGRCMAGGCVSDQECGAGMTCEDGQCVAGGTRVSASCRPRGGGGDQVVELQAVSFDFDKDDLTVDARDLLKQNAQCMREAPSVTVTIEGHADERGTQEYNLGLGERRANAVKAYLKNLGVDMSRVRTLSKGENEPVCNESTETCYSQNRRVEFIQKRSSRM